MNRTWTWLGGIALFGCSAGAPAQKTELASDPRGPSGGSALAIPRDPLGCERGGIGISGVCLAGVVCAVPVGAVEAIRPCAETTGRFYWNGDACTEAGPSETQDDCHYANAGLTTRTYVSMKACAGVYELWCGADGATRRARVSDAQ